MRFTITKEVVTTEEKTIDIRLEQHNQDLCLMVGPYYVLTIKPNGKIVTVSGCKDTGFNVDKTGHVIIEGSS